MTDDQITQQEAAQPAGLPAVAGSLLPCPFCGGDAEEFGFPDEMWVRCKRCRAMMPDDGPLNDHIAAWNDRAGNNQALPPQVGSGD